MRYAKSKDDCNVCSKKNKCPIYLFYYTKASGTETIILPTALTPPTNYYTPPKWKQIKE